MKRKMFLSTLLGVVLLLSACAETSMTESKVTLPDKAHQTPELVIESFVGQVVAKDEKTLLQLFASAPIASRMEIQTVADRVPDYLKQAASLPEVDTEGQKEIMRQRFEETEKNMIQNFRESFSGPAKAESGSVSQNKPSLAKLKVLYVGKIKDFDTSKAAITLQETASSLGAENFTERVILYELDGETFLGGMQFLQFENSWYILSLYSLGIGTPQTGAVFSIEKSDFEKKIKPNLIEDTAKSVVASSAISASQSK